MCCLNLPFRTQAFIPSVHGNAACWRLTAEFLSQHCLCPKEVECPRDISSPQGQSEFKTDQWEAQRLVPSLQFRTTVKGQVGSRTPRSAEVFVATTSQFSYSIFPFLLPSLPHVSVLRSLFSKPIACRAPLQSLHPRKLHLRQMMRSALKESKAEGTLVSASLLLWSWNVNSL